MSAVPYPQRIQSVLVESIDDELCVYDTASRHVHSLNHTAAFVWQRCDGRTAPVHLAAALSAEASLDDAEAVVRLTLQELAAARLLAAPVNEAARVSRRDLLGRGVAVAVLPAIVSIVAPWPAAAQSAPTGTRSFAFTGAAETFVVPAGVVKITIVATGAAGFHGFNALLLNGGARGLGGRTTATVSVTPGASLTVRVGGAPSSFLGGFNGGGGSTGVGGGGGGASSVHDGATALGMAGGGGGGGSGSGGSGNNAGGAGGAGGGLTGDPGETVVNGGGGGGGGTQGPAGGAGGAKSSLAGTNGTDGVAGTGGTGGAHQPGVIGGGGGGGGYFGGGGGGGGNGSNGAGGGGGGSSFTAPGATGVVRQKGVNSGAGSVTISW